MVRFALLIILLGTTFAQAQPFPAVGVAESTSVNHVLTAGQVQAAAAVVRVPTHGISATVIWTGQGKSYLLSCAHGHQGADRAKKMAFDFPWPETPAGPKKAASRVVAIGSPNNDDLTLIELADGPLPWVCPVAPRGHVSSKSALSVGYDDMRWPATQRQATILTALTPTRERPWHGRSGGALIDQDGLLVGVVHGYTGPPTRQEVVRGGQGLYVSHGTIVQFLDRAGYGWLANGAAPSPSAPHPQGGSQADQLRQQMAVLQQQLALLQRQLDQLQGGYTPAPVPRTVPQNPACPDGRCPLQPPPPQQRLPQVLPPCRH